VQVNSACPQTSQTTVTVPYQQAQTAGDATVVIIGWNDSTSTISAVTDGAGNTYRVAAPTVRSTHFSQAIYYASGIAKASAGANTVSVTFNDAVAYPDVRILEYSGLSPVSPLDTSASAAGTTTNASSGNATLASAGELLVGGCATSTAFTGAGTGFVSRVITSPDNDIAEDGLASSSGSYAATAPLYSGEWVMQLAAFKHWRSAVSSNGILRPVAARK
jgi:hypothetical protein